MINNKLFNIPQDVKTKAISKAKKAVVKLLTGKYFKTYGIKTQLDKSSHNYDYFSSMINFI
jgi:dTDP-D-glucose 4,6-dehydratase